MVVQQGTLPVLETRVGNLLRDFRCFGEGWWTLANARCRDQDAVGVCPGHDSSGPVANKHELGVDRVWLSGQVCTDVTTDTRVDTTAETTVGRHGNQKLVFCCVINLDAGLK